MQSSDGACHDGVEELKDVQYPLSKISELCAKMSDQLPKCNYLHFYNKVYYVFLATEVFKLDFKFAQIFFFKNHCQVD